jgi:putative SOS response-associated peptidase YedK
MWAEAFRDRRCVIPASLFYEWGPGSAGKKQAFEFRAPGDDYLWIAGVWEPNADFGPCYSMVTTDAPPIMAPIHDRMPAVLAPEEIDAYLSAGPWTLRPYPQALHVEPCASPLKAKPAGPQQQELF